ncbi:hypothetical protein E0H70_34845 [Rhizobium leguminosarum bv. viciae]|nr:hypothetical protein E0H70_34845 [Rhizobium leguminosarum bv. viciae]
MILHSDFERGSPFPPKRVAHHVLVSNSSMTTGAPALGAQAPVVCQAAAWVGHGIAAPEMLASPREGDDASHR